jgi:hypothetical protein
MQNDNTAALTTPVPPLRASTAARPLLDDPRWQLAQRIAGSRSLGRSALLEDFLLYICDRQLRGKGASITEQRIGVRVFGRPEGYNSSEDNIVRNYARTLRKRIQEYFETEGVHEPLRLEIPRGGYVPVFVEAAAASSLASAPSPLAAAVTTSEEQSAARTQPLETERTGSVPQPPAQALSTHPPREARGRFVPRHAIALTIATLAAVLIAGILIGRSLSGNSVKRALQSSVFAATEDGRNRVFWRCLFQQNQDTYIVPADGGLVMMQSFTRQPVTVEDYARGSYRNHAAVEQQLEPVTAHLNNDLRSKFIHHVEVLGDRRYTSIVDLDLTSQLSRLPAVVPERLMVRYARDLRMDDLRSGNAVLLGSSDANPWVDLFQSQLNFRFDSGVEGGSQRIINQRPLPGERPLYFSDAADPLHHTYGVIAFLPNLGNTGFVVIIEGINMAGTQAAGDFLLNPESMRPVLERAITPNGIVRPFELLLSTNDVAANASRAQILSERVHDNESITVQ